MRASKTLASLVAMLLCIAPQMGFASASFEQLLQEADKVRSSDPETFSARLRVLDAQRGQADLEQRQRLQYLHLYSMVVYEDQWDSAIAQARTLFEQTTNTDLKFRTGSLILTTYALARNFGEGLRYLDQTLLLRHKVVKQELRHDGTNSAAVLYGQLGQYKLSLQFAEEILADQPNPRGRCIATQSRLAALFQLGQLPPIDAPIMEAISQCAALREAIPANLIRLVLAQKWAKQGRLTEAIALLQTHLPEVQATGYSRLIGEMHSLLAELYLASGKIAEAQSHAQAAIAQTAGIANSLPLVMAYKVLYEIARRRDDPVAALDNYRRYAEADKAFLNEITARELVYQIARQENAQKTQQIDLLNGQNLVLQLQQRVDRQSRQNAHLLMVLLVLLVALISYWAYQAKRVQSSLRRLAETDALTGISNRHHFTQQADLALAQSARDGEPAALIMFDLDHFKSINDSYGHDTGDWVLQQVAETCRGHCRRIDQLGRIGGEEFAILLQGIDLHAATRLAEDCRVRMTQIDSRERGHAFVVTASFGVSATPLSGYDLTKLLSHADQMLYSAKRAGRNRVHAFSADASQPPHLQVVARDASRAGGGLSRSTDDLREVPGR